MNALATTLCIQDHVDHFDPQTAHVSFLPSYFNHKFHSRIDGISIRDTRSRTSAGRMIKSFGLQSEPDIRIPVVFFPRGPAVLEEAANELAVTLVKR